MSVLGRWFLPHTGDHLPPPRLRHLCEDHLPDAYTCPLKDVTACGECGRLWFNGRCYEETHRGKCWMPVRWWHRRNWRRAKARGLDWKVGRQ